MNKINHICGQLRRCTLLGVWAAALVGWGQSGSAVIHIPHVPLAGAIHVIQQTIRNGSSIIRAESMESLQNLDRPIRQNLLTKGLHDPSPMVRFSAAMVVGRCRLAALQPVVKKMLADKSMNVRVAAIYALDRLGNSSGMNELPRLLHSAQPSVSANTAMVLGRLGDNSAIPLLLTEARNSSHGVQIAVTSALARLGYHRALSSLIALSLSGYEQDHLAALSTCRTLMNPLAINVLRAGLREPDPAANLIAARGLGQRGSVMGEKAAIRYSHSSKPQLRALAALALGAIPMSGNVAVLTKMLGDSDVHVQVAAAAGLFHFHAMILRLRATRQH